ncbi:MAG: hypothetical protein NVS3B5_17530 [Sphingomicrobium sp.]
MRGSFKGARIRRVAPEAQQLGVDEATVEQGKGALLPRVINGLETEGLPASVDQAVDLGELGGRR